MTKKTTRTATAAKLICSAVFLSLLPVFAAEATDAKMFPGYNCHARLSTDPWILEFQGPGGYNNGSTDIFVSCPILRDDTLNTNGLASVRVGVNVFDAKHPISCSFSSQIGATTSMIVTRTTTKAGASTLDWGTSINTGVQDGVYWLQCTVPQASTISWYRWDEN